MPTSITRRLGAYGAIAGLGLLAPQCAPQYAPAPAPASAPAPSGLQQVVDLTNQRRAEHGLGALAVHAVLNTAAQGHSQDQAARDTMSHTGSDGSNPGDRIARAGYRFSAWAENVAMGYPDAGFGGGGLDEQPGSPGEHPQRQRHPDRHRPRLRRRRLPVLDDDPGPSRLTRRAGTGRKKGAAKGDGGFRRRATPPRYGRGDAECPSALATASGTRRADGAQTRRHRGVVA